MRIRKRFPFSSTASSVSDPQLNNSTLVQQTSSVLHPIQTHDSQPSDPPNHRPSSDQTPLMIKNSLHPHNFQINQKVCLCLCLCFCFCLCLCLVGVLSQLCNTSNVQNICLFFSDLICVIDVHSTIYC